MPKTFKGMVSALAATLLIPFAASAAGSKINAKTNAEETGCLQIVASTLALQKALRSIGEEVDIPLPNTAKYMCHYPETRQRIIKISRDYLKKMSSAP